MTELTWTVKIAKKNEVEAMVNFYGEDRRVAMSIRLPITEINALRKASEESPIGACAKSFIGYIALNKPLLELFPRKKSGAKKRTKKRTKKR